MLGVTLSLVVVGHDFVRRMRGAHGTNVTGSVEDSDQCGQAWMVNCIQQWVDYDQNLDDVEMDDCDISVDQTAMTCTKGPCSFSVQINQLTGDIDDCACGCRHGKGLASYALAVPATIGVILCIILLVAFVMIARRTWGLWRQRGEPAREGLRVGSPAAPLQVVAEDSPN